MGKQKKFLKLNIQHFADNGTSNNDQSARSYQLQFRQLLQAVFQKRAYFRDFFGGGIEALDGVQHNENAFHVKTSDIPVVVGTYDTTDNVAFKEGTGNSTRFGERTEVIYTNTPVPYTWTWAYHEGIDRFTVNNDLTAAVADRLDLQAQAKVNEFNQHHSEFISDNTGHVEQISTFNNESVLLLFNALSNYFVNIQAIGTKVAKVVPELYNAIVDHPLTTSGKKSSANIDANNIVTFKGFQIEEIPDAMFHGNDVCYAYIAGVGKAFTGINTARTIEAHDFDGVALQGAGKAGEFILEDNKKAVVKVEKVNAPIVPTSVKIAPKNPTGNNADAGTKHFNATVSPANATDKSVTFSVEGDNDGGNVTIDSNTGVLSWASGTEPGEYTVKVTTTVGGHEDTATLTISGD